VLVNATSDTITPTTDGNYTIRITDSTGCYRESHPYYHNTTSIKELNQLKSIVFPNPFREYTTILFGEHLNNEYDLLVYDLLGQEVVRKNSISGNKINISKRELGKGLFLAFLISNRTGEKIFIEKLIAQ